MKNSIHAYGHDGKRLANGLGICGGHGDLCDHCFRAEHTEMSEWAKDKPSPVHGERISDYWHRIDGQFLDAWYSVAAGKFRNAGIAIS